MEFNFREVIRQILSENEEYIDALYDTDEYFRKKFSKNRKESKNNFYTVVGFDGRNEFAILKGLNGRLYGFYYAGLNKDLFAPYVSYMIDGVSPDIDAIAVQNYVNDTAETLSKGYGLDAWNSGEGDIVEIDPDLREKLLHDFASSSSIVNSLK